MHIRPIQTDPSSRFPRLIGDFLNRDKSLLEYVSAFPGETSLLEYAHSRRYDDRQRTTLYEALKDQYAECLMSEKTQQNIEHLSKPNSRTITTGHQLNILTGPFFMMSKICNVISLAKRLNGKSSDLVFVPVFWMATEDHDFAEINHTYLHGKKVSWESQQQGAVGRFKLEEIDSMLKEAGEILGDRMTSQQIWKELEKAYSQPTLSDATRSLINSLFGGFGLVIIDGDDKELKALFKVEIEKEITDQVGMSCVGRSIERLSALGYKIQANPRSVNGFYLEDNHRHRLDKVDGKLRAVGRDSLDHDTITTELRNSPEKFSPNAILRPLYQEKILPNVAYVGGGGEISYWLELKAMFEAFEVPFPILMVRSSAWIISTPVQKKLNALGLTFEDFLGDVDALVSSHVKAQSNLDLQSELVEIRTAFEHIDAKARQVEESMRRSIEAEKTKAEKVVLQLEKKLVSRLKAKHETDINKINVIKSKLFPLDKPQERVENLFALSQNSMELIELMIQSCDPLQNQFYLIEPDGPSESHL